MCDRVAVHTSASGAAAEMSILRYLRLLPHAERARLRQEWALPQLEAGGESADGRPPRPPATEEWPAVWGMVLEVVLERAAATLPAEPPASHDTPAQRERRRARLRARAEDEVLRHFHERASVAMPYLRLRAQGLVSLRQMRRRRLGVGALVPPFVAEALCGVAALAAALSCRHAAVLALQAAAPR